jgi:hypothetical protein
LDPVIAVAFKMSELLGCDLDKSTLSTLMALIQLGVPPENLAAMVKELRKKQLELEEVNRQQAKQ